MVVGGAQSDDQVATALRDAINGVGPELAITAAVAPGSNVVTLSNGAQGSFGNVSIYETVRSGSFVVSGMSGGGGYDCPSGDGCKSDQDCATDLVCGTSGICEMAPAP